MASNKPANERSYEVQISYNFDPNAPGRGPGRMHHQYRWYLTNGKVYIGRFTGYIEGVTKADDHLVVTLEGVAGDTRQKAHFRYGDLAACQRIERCPECREKTLERWAADDWRCFWCEATLDHDPVPTRDGRRVP